MAIKKIMIGLLIAGILTVSMPNVVVATTGNYSATFYSNARHIGDRIPMARSSTSNGTSNWNYGTEGNFASFATPNGIVYIGSDDHNVYALNANTGAKIWNYTTGDVVESSPTIANGIVYVGSWDHNVYALNGSTGTKVWGYETGDAVWSSPTVTFGIG